MKKICVVTGTRAEYGLLKPLIKRIDDDKEFELQLIVTGMHLSSEFGNTYKYIEEDGVKITEKIDILLSSDSDVSIAKSMGLCMISFSEVLSRIKPDLLVLLGDRFEIMAIATTATVLKIPIAHLHGGETTEGAYDEAFRHCITKMSYLHFAGAEEYKKRIIQLGENPERVFNVGAVGTENILNLKYLSKEKLEEELNIEIPTNYFVVVFHPVTLEKDTAKNQIRELLDAIKEKEINVVFIKGNSDSNGRIINEMIKLFVENNQEKYKVFSSLTNSQYLNLLKNSNGLIGNSSSGIAETPTLKVGTLNIGNRQKGRIQSEATLNCDCIKKEIVESIDLMMSAQYRNLLKNSKSPYGEGEISKKIVEIIKKIENIDLKKSFYNI